MKVWFFRIYLVSLFLGCQSAPQNYQPKMDLSSISIELTGKTLGGSTKTKRKKINQPLFQSLFFYRIKGKKATEIDIHLFPKTPSGYSQLLEFYNSQFKTAKTDTIFNAWQTDSTEFILFRNSDSSILVNINQRTH